MLSLEMSGPGGLGQRQSIAPGYYFQRLLVIGTSRHASQKTKKEQASRRFEFVP